MNKFFNLFKRKQKDQNLPDLIRKINKNELAKYKPIDFDILEQKKKDPLYMRINLEEYKLDYINEYNKELSFLNKIILKIKKHTIFKIPKYRYSKEIYRPAVNLRQPHFNIIPDNYKFSKESTYILVIILFFILGYFWARLKYDIYLRKYAYNYAFSSMMFFEFLDYKANNILDIINYYLPLNFSEQEAEYLIYKKIKTFFLKRKLNKKVEEVIKTDPDYIEINEILNKINK